MVLSAGSRPRHTPNARFPDGHRFPDEPRGFPPITRMILEYYWASRRQALMDKTTSVLTSASERLHRYATSTALLSQYGQRPCLFNISIICRQFAQNHSLSFVRCISCPLFFPAHARHRCAVRTGMTMDSTSAHGIRVHRRNLRPESGKTLGPRSLL